MKRKASSRSLHKLKEVWRRFRKSKSAMLGLIILILIILTAVFADVIVAKEKVTAIDASARLLSPSWEHPFGTDAKGRDMFARVVHAAPISLYIGVAAALLNLFIGSVVGISSGYFGGRYDEIVMRFIDIISSLPAMLLAMIIVAVMGASMNNMILAMVITQSRATARVTRAAVLSISGNEYIEAAHCGGSGHFHIIMRHIVPNIMGTLIVNTTMNVAICILLGTALSFIGLGVQPPTPEWGSLLNDARSYMRSNAYIMIFPGLAILLTSLSVNLVGDGLRDAFDPRLKS